MVQAMEMRWRKPRNVLTMPLCFKALSNGQFIGQHSVRGASKEKSKKLDELKARRKAKDEKKRVSKDIVRASCVSHGF